MLTLKTAFEYTILSLPQRVEVFDNDLHEILNGWTPDDIYRFLQQIILNEEENADIRRRALAAMTNYCMLNKIKPRKVLTILIDNWPNEAGVFLNLQRIRDLHLLYPIEPDEIELALLSYINSAEVELSSEAHYRIGLIKFQLALDAVEIIRRDHLLEQCRFHLGVSISEVENRVDASFMDTIANILQNLFLYNLDTVSRGIESLANILFQMNSMSVGIQQNVLQLSLYRAVASVQKILLKRTASAWDFRDEMTKIFCHFSELQNQKVKDRLVESNISSAFVQVAKTSFIEPYFATNLSADLARVNSRLLELSPSSSEAEFLVYLRDLLRESGDKKKVVAEALQERLVRTFNYRNPAEIESALKLVKDFSDPHQIVNVCLSLAKPSLHAFIDSLIQACVRLQKNPNYKGDCLENDRNTFISDMLISAKYRVRDQTLWGQSAAGKLAGEIDIYVDDNSGLPYTIIEALNLNSLDSGYLKLHLDKLFNYDTAGHIANFILVYSTAKKFGIFWSNYTNFVKSHTYQYQFLAFEDVALYPYSNLKVCRTDHLRENQKVELYHIVLDMKD